MPDATNSGFQDVTQGVQSPSREPTIEDLAKPKYDVAWKVKKRKMQGKGNSGKPLPKAATKAVAKQVMEAMVKEVAESVVKNEPVKPEAAYLVENMSPTTRANLLSLLGPDIESARQHFADKMLMTANKIHDRIEREIEDLPHSTLAFTMSVLLDKQEALRTKAGTSAGGAKVGNQINLFCDGTVNREEIISRLTGAAFGVEQETKPVAPSATLHVEASVSMEPPAEDRSMKPR